MTAVFIFTFYSSLPIYTQKHKISHLLFLQMAGFLLKHSRGAVWVESCLPVVKLSSCMHFRGFNEKHQDSGKSLVEQTIHLSFTCVVPSAMLHHKIPLIFISRWLHVGAQNSTAEPGNCVWRVSLSHPSWGALIWFSQWKSSNSGERRGWVSLWTCDGFVSFKTLWWNDFLWLWLFSSLSSFRLQPRQSWLGLC